MKTETHKTLVSHDSNFPASSSQIITMYLVRFKPNMTMSIPEACGVSSGATWVAVAVRLPVAAKAWCVGPVFVVAEQQLFD